MERGWQHVKNASLWSKLLFWQCIAEAIGVFILTVSITGAIGNGVLGSLVGVWQVAVPSGLGVALAIYLTYTISGAHLNPAISICHLVYRRKSFPVYKFFLYCLSQLVGGVAGGIAVYTMFEPLIRQVENNAKIHRGSSGSELTAQLFGCYFPIPGLGIDEKYVSHIHAILVEAFGTAMLSLVAFGVSDTRNSLVKRKEWAAWCVGILVMIIVGIFAPQTGACWNPARDFGPRLVSLVAGWGSIAIPGPRDGFYVYLIGPTVGALLGATAYQFLLRPGYKLRQANKSNLDNSAEVPLEEP